MDLQTLQKIYPYLLPPLFGAVIGYVTNHIAIRMLFRPLRPWRIFGIRVPLTPGIIPSKRGELAQKMGEMVGSHLLTSSDVGRALERKTFRRELKGAVADKLAQFLDRDLGPVEALVPPNYRTRFRDLVDLLRWKTVKVVFDYLEGPDFENKLRTFLQRKGDELLARDMESFLTPSRYDQLRRHMEERIAVFLRSESVGRSVGHFVDAKTEQWLTTNRTIRELLPADLVEVILAQLEKEIPPLLEKFGGMLYDPEFRERLVQKGKEGIESFLESLEGLSALLAGFFDMNKVYDRIPEFLDKAGDEIARWLREEKTHTQVAGLLRERLDGMLDRPFNSYLERVPYEKVSGVRRFIRQRSIEMVQGRRMTETTMTLLERGIERIKDRSFSSILTRVLPTGGLEKSRNDLTDRLLNLVRSSGAREAFAEILRGKSEEWLFQRPLGKLSARIPGDVREELAEGLFRQLAELLKNEVPPLIETLNVNRMVEEKVNSLDILKVEGLLMGVMQEQFKYINLFGALLGFLIGLLNLLAFKLF